MEINPLEVKEKKLTILKNNKVRVLILLNSSLIKSIHQHSAQCLGSTLLANI